MNRLIATAILLTCILLGNTERVLAIELEDMQVRLNVALIPVDPRDAMGRTALGAEVTKVHVEGAGKEAGIEAGDIILRFGEHEINDPEQLKELIAQTKLGSTIPLMVLRGSKVLTLEAHFIPL